jgi:hypothetical protein
MYIFNILFYKYKIRGVNTVAQQSWISVELVYFSRTPCSSTQPLIYIVQKFTKDSNSTLWVSTSSSCLTKPLERSCLPAPQAAFHQPSTEILHDSRSRPDVCSLSSRLHLVWLQTITCSHIALSPPLPLHVLTALIFCECAGLNTGCGEGGTQQISIMLLPF